MPETKIQAFGMHPGHVVQKAYTKYTPQTSFAGNVGGNVVDDSIPQNTQGVEIFTLSITPKFSSSLLRVHAQVIFSSNSNTHQVAFICRDSDADAVGSAWLTGQPSIGYGMSLMVNCDIPANATTLTTLKFRMWASGGTMYVNGYTARYLGGTMSTFMSIEETKA